MNNAFNIVGACPKCGCSVLEKDKIFICEAAKFKQENGKWVNMGCSFKVFRNQIYGLGHPKISVDEMRDILSSGYTTVELLSKNNTFYKVRLELNKKKELCVKFRNKNKE
ncbi:hypothetical protein ACHJH3_06520 [Campylobacter sp. MOP7]|uniref:hypothetical protein n=1 Tax=Campylobacter canis TaxID=3378588 RepID=UPI00387ED295